MTSWKPYVWKELRQNLWLGLAALGVFLGITLIPSILSVARSRWNWYDGNALGMMLWGGPFLAVIAGVCAMGREQGAVEGFWRSRPVDLSRWLASKYVTGLAIVWLVCWIPLLITLLGRVVDGTHPRLADRMAMLLSYAPILMLIYSASFVLGQCVRGILHAAILAVGVMALIFVMPLVIAPLNWLSLEALQRVNAQSLDVRSYAAFAAGMTAVSMALLWLAGVLLKRSVQVDVNQRTLGWSLAAILLVLAAGVAFPMGANLSAQQVISLPINQEGRVYVDDMAADGNDVLVLLLSRPEDGDSRNTRHGLVRVHIGERASVADNPIWFADPGQGQNLYYTYAALDLAWSAENPSLAYVVVKRTEWEDRTVKKQTHTLCTIALDPGQGDPVVHRVELDPLLGVMEGTLTACLYQRCLYIYCDEFSKARLLTFSLADSRAPSLIHSEHLAPRIELLFPTSAEQYQIRLVPIPDLDDPARLEITHELAACLWTPAGDNRILASTRDPDGFAVRLVLFETGPTQDGVMSLHPVAQRRTGALERLLGLSYGKFSYSAHLVYQLSGSGATVYDIGNSKQIERIGHYAAEGGFSAMVSLPGNRVVLAGKRLHVLDLSERLSSRSVR